AYVEKGYKSAVSTEEVIQKERRPLEKNRAKLTEEEKERLDFLRQYWVESEFQQALLLYERAATYESGTADYKQALTKARDEFLALYEKHPGRMVGLTARLRQSQCHVELKEFTEAVEVLEELLSILSGDAPEVRTFQMEAIRFLMDAYIGQKKYDDALKMYGFVLRKHEQDQPAGQGLLYFGAVALKAKADEIEDPDKAKQKEKEEYIDKASDIAKDLSKKGIGEWRDKGIKLLEDLGKPPETTADAGPPQSFEEAVKQANAALQTRRLLRMGLANATAAQKPELEKNFVDETDKAFSLYRQAVAFSDHDTKRATLAKVYQAICYLYWDRGDHLYAAILGDFLSRQFPTEEASKFGTMIAMNGWLMEYQTAKNDRSYETRQIKRFAERLAKRWPDSSEAIDARFHLIVFALQDREVESAFEQLQAIPVSDIRRGMGELMVGQTLWSKYATERRLPEEDRPSQESLDQLLSKCRTVLSDGLNRMQDSGKVTRNLIGAAYSLAQLHSGTNEPVKALELLENPKYGPLTLVRAKNQLAIDGNYELKTYKLALRTYVSALPSHQGDAAKQEEMIDKALKMVDALEATISAEGDDDAAGQLTRIYTDISSELEAQINQLQDDAAGKEATTRAFVKFLDKIRQREVTLGSLIWIAETFNALGKANLNKNGTPTKKGIEFLQRAAETYQSILDRAAEDPTFLRNPRQRTTIEVHLAGCYRNMGDYEKTIDILEAILLRKVTNLTVQRDAAETLYQAGIKGGEKGSVYFKNAILGTRTGKNGKNVVWGWKKLGKVTEPVAKFRSYYLDSRLYDAKCKVGFGMLLDDQKEKTKLLEAALTTIQLTYEQSPELGDEERRGEYDRFARKVQALLGQPEAGLKAFEKPARPEENFEEETK
ncbi:MAG: hypothetical protein WBF93_20830, partial [Pirellulales bacterium]